MGNRYITQLFLLLGWFAKYLNRNGWGRGCTSTIPRRFPYPLASLTSSNNCLISPLLIAAPSLRLLSFSSFPLSLFHSFSLSLFPSCPLASRHRLDSPFVPFPPISSLSSLSTIPSTIPSTVYHTVYHTIYHTIYRLLSSSLTNFIFLPLLSHHLTENWGHKYRSL